VAGLQERVRRSLEHDHTVLADEPHDQLVCEGIQHLEPALLRACPVPEALVAKVLWSAGGRRALRLHPCPRTMRTRDRRPQAQEEHEVFDGVSIFLARCVIAFLHSGGL
jgi:hypothetical protein